MKVRSEVERYWSAHKPERSRCRRSIRARSPLPNPPSSSSATPACWASTRARNGRESRSRSMRISPSFRPDFTCSASAHSTSCCPSTPCSINNTPSGGRRPRVSTAHPLLKTRFLTLCNPESGLGIPQQREPRRRTSCLARSGTDGVQKPLKTPVRMRELDLHGVLRASHPVPAPFRSRAAFTPQTRMVKPNGTLPAPQRDNPCKRAGSTFGPRAGHGSSSFTADDPAELVAVEQASRRELERPRDSLNRLPVTSDELPGAL